MTLTVDARLVLGVYDAGDADDPGRRRAEWPPHPIRLFDALVDAAHLSEPLDAAGDAALRWLEAQPPPEVWASRSVTDPVREAWVPVNSLPKIPKHTLYPGRESAGTPKAWPREIPRTGSVRFVWPHSDPDDATLATLARLANRIPYLGRSSTPVVVTIENGSTSTTPAGELDRFEPDQNGDLALRVPFDGALVALRRAHEDGQPAVEVRADVGYRSPRREEVAGGGATGSGEPGPEALFTELITLRLLPPPGLDGSAALAITSQLRRALMACISTNVPAAVHGHDAGVPHVAYLALPDVGYPHSSGRVLGVGVALPVGLGGEDRRTILGALLGVRGGPSLDHLSLPPPLSRSGMLRAEPWRAGPPRACVPERWTGGTQGHRWWASVTPVVLDRYPKGEDRIEAEIRRSLSHAGLPQPVEGGVRWSTVSFVRGGARPRPHQVQRQVGEHRPYRHVLVEFDQRVRGPVIIGRMRHYGVGLCVPVYERASSGEPSPVP